MPPKILVVEDEAIIALDIQNYLNNAGFEVVSTAAEGREAIQKAEELKPDLVLMDIMLMDDMDGIEAAEEIQTSDIPVIFLTAYTDEIIRAKSANPYGFITKPVNFNDLKASIEIALYKHELDKKLKETHDNLELQVKERTEELEEAYKTLSENELKFREIFYNANDMITLAEIKNGMPGRYIEVNDAACKQLGYSREELLKMTPMDIMSQDSQFKVPKIIENLSKMNFATVEKVHVAKNGSRIPVEVSTHIFMLNGRKVALAISRDITERKIREEELKKSYNSLKQSEELYKTLAENSPYTIRRLDKNLKFIYSNKGTFYGLSKEDFIGKHVDEIGMDKKITKEWKIGSQNAFETGKIQELIDEIPSFSGLLSFKSLIVPEFNIENEIESILVITQDITKIKNIETELKVTIQELKRSNEELERFAYVASHDLQEPLRTIASFTQLLERRYKHQLDSDADEFMDFIVDAAKQMKEQIEGLLEYSRIETKENEFKQVDTNKILKKSLKSLDTSIKESNAEVKYDKLPVVLGDVEHLYRVFQNLISNSIKFRKLEEQLKIHISAYESENKNEYIFSVADNGIGIEEQYKERIFIIFQRLHTRDVYNGTGMGLSIVKRVIERHGGHVWVESEFGKGSTFYFTIPVKE